MNELLRIENLRKTYITRAGGGKKVPVAAVDGVSFSVGKGETLGLVGESGCGKSTLGRSILRLVEPDSGRIVFGGADITHADMRPYRRKMQIVLQDPAGSLDPRSTVAEIVSEGLRAAGVRSAAERRARAEAMLARVGLSRCLDRYPHEFSGGQQQRIGIARALMVEPQFLVCDEPVSALDVSCQAQIVNLLCELQKDLALTYLFISHDLSVVRYVSDRIAVMYLGRILELGPTAALCDAPAHPYTRELIAAIPVPDPARYQGAPVPPADPPEDFAPAGGCRFRPRCPQAAAECAADQPLREISPGHWAACCKAASPAI